MRGGGVGLRAWVTQFWQSQVDTVGLVPVLTTAPHNAG